MTTTPATTPPAVPAPMTGLRLNPRALEQQRLQGSVAIVDVREPIEFATGHIPGSRNLPLASLAGADLPPGPIVLVCNSGNRSQRALAQLRRRGHSQGVADLDGGLMAWEQLSLPLERSPSAPLPLMRQVQIAAGSLVLLGVVLSQTVAIGWIWLSGAVGAGLVVAGITGFCGMARLLAAMPWNRLRP